MNGSHSSLICGRYMDLKYRGKNFQSTFVRKMSRGRCYLSRQVWGKAANPLHMLVLGGSASPLWVSLSRCFLRLLFSTRRVLYRHPLGFGPTAKPIRLECCGSLGVAAGRACFQDWAAVWVSLVQQVQQHRGAGCRRLKVGTAATGSFRRLSCCSRWQPSLSVAEPTMAPKWPHA